MKEIYIRKIEVGKRPESLGELTALLDTAGVESVAVDCVNWKDFPYSPGVKVRMAHTGDALLLHWTVSEQYVRAMADADNGPVWEDSCVEFFIRPDQCSPYYYNVECNCAGTLLIGRGTGNQDRVHAAQSIMEGVCRFTTVDGKLFDTREAPAEWHVGLYIPVSSLFADEIDSLDGRVMTGNFYKCGDALPQPHFLSWNPISLPAPMFHCPDHFGLLRFE